MIMLIVCLIYLLLVTWCQCDDKSSIAEGKQLNDQQDQQTARLHHFGHYGRIIASPTGVTDLAESLLEPDESSSEIDIYKQSDFLNRPSTSKKRNKNFHQAIHYFPRRRWDHHLDDYHHHYYHNPNHYQSRYQLYGQQQQFERRGYEDFHLFSGQHGGMDRSDFYYVLPILLVIGLGAFLIPIITTFFTALVTSNTAFCGRRKRNDNFVADWRPLLQEKVLEMWTTVEKAVQMGLQKYGNNSGGANDSLNRFSNQNKNGNSTNTNHGGKG